jgi:hypothetical protein
MALADLLLWTLIVTHSVILFCDFTQLVPQFDFVTRADGSASDKYNLLPLETIYAAVTSIAFGTVAAALLMAAIGLGPIRFAALISCFVHAIWLLHMVWQWDVWTEMMHPDGSMTPTFFMMTHVVFLAMSALLCVQPEPSAASKKKSS